MRKISYQENQVLEKLDTLRFFKKVTDRLIESDVTIEDLNKVLEGLIGGQLPTSQLGEAIVALIEDTVAMFVDLRTNKKYQYKFQISEEGHPQMLYKEIENV